MSDIHGPPKDIDLQIVTKDVEVDFSDACNTGGELVLSYVEEWSSNFRDGAVATGDYTLSPGLDSSSPLGVHALSAAPDQIDIQIYDHVRGKSVRYVLTARDTGGVDVIVGKVGESDNGTPLSDGPEKALLLSQIAHLLLDRKSVV